MSNYLVEVLLQARNQLGPALAEASEQLELVNRKFGTAGGPLGQAFSRLSGIGGGFSQIFAGGGLTTGLVAAGAAMTAFSFAAVKAVEGIKSLADEAQELTTLSQRTGVATGSLEGMRTELGLMKLPADSLTTAFKFLESAMGPNATKEAKAALQELGITARDPVAALMQLADAFHASTDAAGHHLTQIQKNTDAMALLGSRGGVALIPFLNLGSQATRSLTKELQGFGYSLSENAINKLLVFRAESELLSLKWQGAMRQMQISLLPFLESLIALLDKLLLAAQAIGSIAASGALIPGFIPNAGGRPGRRGSSLAIGGGGSPFFFSLPGGAGGAGGRTFGPQTFEDSMEAISPGFKNLMSDPAYATIFAILKQGGLPDTTGGGGGGGSSLRYGARGAGLPSGFVDEIANAMLDYNSSRGQPGPPGLRGLPDPKATAKAFENLTKSMKDVEVPALKITDDFGLKVKHALEVADQVTAKFAGGATAAFQRAFDRILTITTSSTNVLVQLMADLLNSFIQAFTDAIAKAAGDALSNAIAPVIGGVIGNVFHLPAVPHGLSPMGGATTVNISAISAKDVIQQLISPNGDFRRANMRLREVAATR